MSWWKKIWEAIKKLWEKEPEPEPDQYPDAIDWKDITFLGVNVGGWEKKYELKVSLSGSKIIYDQEGTSNWTPKVVGASLTAAELFEDDKALSALMREDEESATTMGTSLVGNPWIIAKLNGKWTAATHEWMRPSQREKGKRSVHGDHIKRAEFGSDWVPTVGEEYGFCVSGLCRGADRNEQERTQIVMMIWS